MGFCVKGKLGLIVECNTKTSGMKSPSDWNAAGSMKLYTASKFH